MTSPVASAQRSTARPDGPRASVAWQTMRFATEPLGFLDACRDRYGDTFSVRLLGLDPLVITSDPELIRDVFTGGESAYLGGRPLAGLRRFVGARSILVLDGAEHRRERQVMNPSFHGRNLQAIDEPVRDMADKVIDGWEVGSVVDLRQAIHTLTLSVVIRTFFGVGDGPEFDELFHATRRCADAGSQALLKVPVVQRDLGRHSPYGRFVRLRGEFDRLILRAVRDRRRTPRDDILSILVNERDREGRTYDNNEVIDEIRTLVLAACHDTTANTLSWLFRFLLPRPDLMEQIRAEVTGGVVDGDVNSEIGADDILSACIIESQRLYPIIVMNIRELAEDRRFGDHDLHAGDRVAVSSYLTHRRADLFERPDEFRPERWRGTTPDRFCFFPFGGGGRRCLGMHFAMSEMRVATARILERTTLELPPGDREPSPRFRGRNVVPSHLRARVAEMRAGE